MSRKTIIAAVVALLALGICGVLFMALIGPAVGNVFENTVSDVIGISAATGEDFLQALKDSDYDAAYSLLHPEVQDEISGPDALESLFPSGSIDTWESDSDFVTTADGESAVAITGVLTLSDGSQLDMQLIITRAGEENLVAGFLFQPLEPSTQDRPTDQVDELMLLGADHMEDGNLESAIDAYSEAIGVEPEFIDAYVARASAYLQLGQVDDAMADINHALAIDPNHIEAYTARGMAHSLAGNFEEAIQDFDRALPGLDESIQAAPELASAYFSRGTAYFFLLEYEMAIADFDRAIEMDPEYLEAYAVRGNSFDNMGDFQAAVADYAMALSLSTNSSQRALVLYDLGQAYARNGNIELATSNIEEALELGLPPLAAEDAEAVLEFLAQADSSELPEADLTAVWELPHFDDFSDSASGWEVGEYVGGTVGYEDGVYVVTATVIGSQMWAIPNQSFDDVEITVQARQVNGPSNNNNSYGVACRVGQGLTGYFFLISGDGFFAIFRVVEPDSVALVPWTETNFVKKGNSFNDIRAICDGEELSFYINGELAASVQDSALESADIALTAATFEDELTEIHFDNLELNQP